MSRAEYPDFSTWLQKSGQRQRIEHGFFGLRIDTRGFTDPQLTMLDLYGSQPTDLTYDLAWDKNLRHEWVSVLTENNKPVIAVVEESYGLNQADLLVVNMHPDDGTVGVIYGKNSWPLRNDQPPKSRSGSGLYTNQLIIPFGGILSSQLTIIKTRAINNRWFEYKVSLKR